MVFKVQRTDPSWNLIDEVFIADASDVSTLGNGLQVGDVVVHWTSTVQGSIPVQAGQTIVLDSDMGPYAGVHMVTNYFAGTGANRYAVIDAEDLGDFTPDAFLGGMRVWLNNYTVYLKLLVYTDPSGTPHEVILDANPDGAGACYFEVGSRIKDYFSHRIDTMLGSGAVFNAHGITALFYRVHFAEVYDVPGDTDIPDPFDGDHNVLVDATDSVATFRVAVNAVHPYAGPVVDWTDTDMSAFEVGSPTSFWLTGAPRNTAGLIQVPARASDPLRAFMLTDPGEDHEVDYKLYVYGDAGLIGTVNIEIPTTTTAAFAVAIGPSDIPLALPKVYTVRLAIEGEDELPVFKSEALQVDMEAVCRENERTFAWLNKLGGVDVNTFTGREIGSSRTKRATVQKPYNTGSSFDWRMRTYRAEPERTRTVSTSPIRNSVRRWLADDLSESANVISKEYGLWCPVVLTSGDVRSYSTGPGMQPMTIEFFLGVDNLSQSA